MRGDPAFPQSDGVRAIENGVGGMSLRDYFAGQALIGLFAESSHPESPGITDFERIAQRAYGIADAMVAERARDAD